MNIFIENVLKIKINVTVIEHVHAACYQLKEGKRKMDRTSGISDAITYSEANLTSYVALDEYVMLLL